MSSIPCPAPWDGAVVHFSGVVYPCDSMSQGPESRAMQLGDLRTHSLQEILEGPRAERLRSRLLTGEVDGLLCQQCDKRGTCNLYGDPNSGSQTKTKNHNPTDRQALVRLELGLTDLCNMRCIMCCLTRGEASPPEVAKNGMMETSLALRALEEAVALSEEPPLVLLHWVGEPLIHPDIETILKRTDELGARLHLVTNGIQLTESIQRLLLSFQGNHVLNVSLNAWDPDIYAVVNQSKKHSQVHRQLYQFLQLREEQNKQDHWSVMASAVVLEENREDIPNFVRQWTDRLSRYGPVSIGLNGKGMQEQLQIQILCELDDPLSPARFRSVLRACSITDPDWPLEPFVYADELLLGRSDSQLVQMTLTALSGLSIKLQREVAGELLHLRHIRWADDQLKRLLNMGWDQNVRYARALHQLAFEDHRRLDSLPVSIEQAGNSEQVLLWCQLVPTAASELLAVGLNSIEPRHLGELAAILHWDARLAKHLPDDLTFPQSLDGSSAIIALSRGRDRADLGSPLPWQVEAIAGLISQHERSIWHLKCNRSVVSSDLAGLIVSLAIDPKVAFPTDMATRLADAPDWQIRALRRRLMFAKRSPEQQWVRPVSSGIEGLLLALLMSPEESLPALIERTIEAIPQTSAVSHQDLAEVLASRPLLQSRMEWSLAVPMWQRMLECPLLGDRSASQLAVAAILKELGLAPRSMGSLTNERLTSWQQRQWDQIFGGAARANTERQADGHGVIRRG